MKGPATPLGTPGTPIQHAHTPITSMISQMSSMNIQPGTPGTPGPPHPSQQMGMWNTPEHNTTQGEFKYSKISRFLERILMEYIESKNS